MVLAFAGDRDVAEQTARIPHPLTQASVESWIEAAIGDASKETVFAIERKQDGSFLGVVGLVLGSEEDTAELGCWLGKPYWNNGYMTEAVLRVLGYAFTQRSLPAVRACAYLGNAASVRVQEKVGMRLIGRERRAAPARGDALREAEIRELRREDWPG